MMLQHCLLDEVTIAVLTVLHYFCDVARQNYNDAFEFIDCRCYVQYTAGLFFQICCEYIYVCMF